MDTRMCRTAGAGGKLLLTPRPLSRVHVGAILVVFSVGGRLFLCVSIVSDSTPADGTFQQQWETSESGPFGEKIKIKKSQKPQQAATCCPPA